MLVMGFSGAKAAFWRERYIQAFNLMEAELRKQALLKAEPWHRRHYACITAPREQRGCHDRAGSDDAACSGIYF
jgi:phage regulator Rha-like protein